MDMVSHITIQIFIAKYLHPKYFDAKQNRIRLYKFGYFVFWRNIYIFTNVLVHMGIRLKNYNKR